MHCMSKPVAGSALTLAQLLAVVHAAPFKHHHSERGGSTTTTEIATATTYTTTYSTITTLSSAPSNSANATAQDMPGVAVPAEILSAIQSYNARCTDKDSNSSSTIVNGTMLGCGPAIMPIPITINIPELLAHMNITGNSSKIAVPSNATHANIKRCGKEVCEMVAAVPKVLHHIHESYDVDDDVNNLTNSTDSFHGNHTDFTELLHLMNKTSPYSGKPLIHDFSNSTHFDVAEFLDHMNKTNSQSHPDLVDDKNFNITEFFKWSNQAPEKHATDKQENAEIVPHVLMNHHNKTHLDVPKLLEYMNETSLDHSTEKPEKAEIEARYCKGDPYHQPPPTNGGEPIYPIAELPANSPECVVQVVPRRNIFQHGPPIPPHGSEEHSLDVSHAEHANDDKHADNDKHDVDERGIWFNVHDHYKQTHGGDNGKGQA